MTLSKIAKFPCSSSSPISKDVIRQVFGITANHAALPLFALKALRGTSRDIEQVVNRAMRRVVITERYPLRRLDKLIDLISLRIHPEIREQHHSDLYEIYVDRENTKWIQILDHLFQFASIINKAFFKVKQLDYRAIGGHAHDADLHHLLSLTNLVRLDLEKLRFVTDIGLREIGKLSRLEELSLSHCPNVGGKGILHLSDLRSLKSIDLSGQTPTDLKRCGALDLLMALPKLNDIKFGNLSPRQIEILSGHEINQRITALTAQNLKNSDFDNLFNLTQLNELKLIYDQIELPFANLNKIDRLVRLKILKLRLFTFRNFRDSRISIFFETLSNLPNLSDLRVRSDRGSVKNVLSKFTRLDRLSLYGFETIFAHEFHSYSQLRTLHLFHIDTEDGKGWPFCLPLRALRSQIFRTLLSLSSLRNLPNLESLDLSSALLPLNFDLSILADLQHLKRLNMDFSCALLKERDELLGEDRPSQLSTPLPNLEQLSLRGCKLTKENFDFIAKMPNLAELDVTYARYSKSDLKNLQIEKPMLRIITLKGDPIGKGRFWGRVATYVCFVAKAIWVAIKSYFLDVFLLKR